MVISTPVTANIFCNIIQVDQVGMMYAVKAVVLEEFFKILQLAGNQQRLSVCRNTFE